MSMDGLEAQPEAEVGVEAEGETSPPLSRRELFAVAGRDAILGIVVGGIVATRPAQAEGVAGTGPIPLPAAKGKKPGAASRRRQSTLGAWEILTSPSGATTIPNVIVAPHAAILPTGNVLLFGGYDDDGILHPEHPEGIEGPAVTIGGLACVLDVGNRTATSVPLMKNAFCSGHAYLHDGRLVVAGGRKRGGQLTQNEQERQTRGVRAVRTFRAEGGGGLWEERFSERNHYLLEDRWYPTCIAVGFRVLILSGSGDIAENVPAVDIEMFPINSDATQANRDPNADTFKKWVERIQVKATSIGGEHPHTTYPLLSVVPTGPQAGKILVHIGARTRFLDPNTWTLVPNVQAMTQGYKYYTYPAIATYVMLPLTPANGYRGQLMVMGGGAGATYTPEPNNPDPFHEGSVHANAGFGVSALQSCQTLVLDEDSPLFTQPYWKVAPSMHHPRIMADAVLLPDKTVFVTGGSTTGGPGAGTHPVVEPEIYNPATGVWSKMATATVQRSYHAASILLPDGRVLTAGTDTIYNRDWRPEPDTLASFTGVPNGLGNRESPEKRIEIYSPPYMFASSRPNLLKAPPTVAYDRPFQAYYHPSQGTPDSATLVRLGSVTHSVNVDQRCIELSVVSQHYGMTTFQGPPNENVAPPGIYMLFLLKNGIPSVSKMVRVWYPFWYAGTPYPLLRNGTAASGPALLTTYEWEYSINPDQRGVFGYVYQSQFESPGLLPLYRLFNRFNGDRIFTVDANEYNSLLDSQGWNHDGIQCYVYPPNMYPANASVVPGLIPVHRYANTNGRHFYATDTAEPGSGWTYEGIAFYVKAAARIPLYRVQNGGFDNVLTTYRPEYELCAQYNWTNYGIVGYVDAQPASSPYGTTIPLYRLFNGRVESHFYAVSEKDRDRTCVNPTQSPNANAKWNDDAIQCYVLPRQTTYDPAVYLPLLRAYNPQTYQYLTTTDWNEFNNLGSPWDKTEEVDPSGVNSGNGLIGLIYKNPV
jgi:hypothetical protein